MSGSKQEASGEDRRAKAEREWLERAHAVLEDLGELRALDAEADALGIRVDRVWGGAARGIWCVWRDDWREFYAFHKSTCERRERPLSGRARHELSGHRAALASFRFLLGELDAHTGRLKRAKSELGPARTRLAMAREGVTLSVLAWGLTRWVPRHRAAMAKIQDNRCQRTSLGGEVKGGAMSEGWAPVPLGVDWDDSVPDGVTRH